MDPFAAFMGHWEPTCGFAEAYAAWCAKRESFATAYVVPDLEPWRDTSGKLITGRRAWREHLRALGLEEYGHGDLKAATERFAAKQARKQALGPLPSAPVDVMKARPSEPSRAARRLQERLYGRPEPDRRTLIGMAIEERTRK